MSTWTHINGQIRVDGIPDMDTMIDMGNTCHFESTDEEWEKCDVPCGSEGSVQYSTNVVGTGMVWYNINIWGDLRDFGREEEHLVQIVNWIKTKTSGHSIRQASIEISIEGIGTFIMRFDRNCEDWMDDEKRWVIDLYEETGC